MEVEPVVHQSEPEIAETEIDTEEQSEQLETEPITAADVAPEKPSETTNTQLQFNSLIPFKNHPQGMSTFSENCQTYMSETPLEHFVSALKYVMSDKSLATKQTDPIEIISAFEEWEAKKPATFENRLDLSIEERKLKDAVDKKFITYMSVLRSTNVISIPVRVFCHMCSKDGCPPKFRNFNDRTFKKANMDDVIKILDGQGSKPWNNIHNASMHMMLPWSDEELKHHIAPAMEQERWENLTPKEIGRILEEWFESLDNDELKNRKDLEGVLVPKAGQHRCGAIPRWVKRQSVPTWQGIFGTHFQMNFWLKGEQQVCKYLSGCIQDLDLTAPSVQWSDQALRFLDQTAVDWYQAKWRSQSEWGSKETKE